MTNEFTYVDIEISTPFPIITVHDFEMIHQQDGISDYTANCTIYAITQRSAIYFNELNLTKLKNEQILSTKITDGINNSIECEFKIPPHWEVNQVECKYYNKTDRANANGDILYKVEAIQFKIKDNKLEWICPTDFIARHYKDPKNYSINGDISPYMNYELFYIGKATKQSLTKRLSNHRKLTRILSLEEPINTQGISLPHELTIMCFNIKSSSKNLGKNFVADDIEAALINKFNPKYNDIKFNNYPNIKNGFLSRKLKIGEITFSNPPIQLHTEKYQMQDNLLYLNKSQQVIDLGSSDVSTC